MTYYAHSIPNESTEKWQSLKIHLNNVAELGSNFAKHFNSSNWAYTAGLMHDLGKYSYDFQRMLNEASGEGKILKVMWTIQLQAPSMQLKYTALSMEK